MSDRPRLGFGERWVVRSKGETGVSMVAIYTDVMLEVELDAKRRAGHTFEYWREQRAEEGWERVE